MKLYTHYLAHSLADFHFPILPWDDVLLVQPRVHAIGFQAGVQGADFVRVRVGVAEEDFEGVFGLIRHGVSPLGSD
jgi:hypothetical protein